MNRLNSRHFRKPLTNAAVLLVLWACCRPLHAQEPAASDAGAAPSDSLLRLVDENVGVCFEATDLRTRVPEFLSSDFHQRLEGVPFYQRWRGSADFQKLAQLGKAIEALTGKPLGRFASEMLGRSVVVAVYPGEEDEPRAMILTRAANAEAIEDAVAAWKRAEPSTHRTRTHAGSTYIERTKTRGKKPTRDVSYYAQLDDVFVISEHADLVRNCLSLSAGDAEGLLPLSVSSRYRAVRADLATETVASVYVNPRVWDDSFEPPADAKAGDRIPWDVWQRIESLAFGLRIDEGIAVEAAARFNGENAAWTDFVKQTSDPAAFLDRAPPDAVAVVASRIDLSHLGTALESLIEEQDQTEFRKGRRVLRGLLMGLDLFDDVLPRLGPDMGAYAVPRSSFDGGRAPFDWLAAITISAARNEADGNNEEPDFQAAMENALTAATNLIAAARNQKPHKTPAIVRLRDRNDLRIHWIDGLTAWKPAYALTPGFLVFAGSPELIEAFTARETPAKENRPRFQVPAAGRLGDSNQLAVVDTAALGRFVNEHRDKLVEYAVATHALDDAEARKRITRFENLLGLFDGLYLAARFKNHRCRLVLGGATESARNAGPPDEKATNQRGANAR